jgi:hypothetical protein
LKEIVGEGGESVFTNLFQNTPRCALAVRRNFG